MTVRQWAEAVTRPDSFLIVPSECAVPSLRNSFHSWSWSWCMLLFLPVAPSSNPIKGHKLAHHPSLVFQMLSLPKAFPGPLIISSSGHSACCFHPYLTVFYYTFYFILYYIFILFIVISLNLCPPNNVLIILGAL